MKNKIFKQAFLIFSASGIFFLISVLCPSCQIKYTEYSLGEGFYRLMKVERRATILKVLSSETDINSIASDEEYDVLIVTDVHMGNENYGKNGPRRESEWLKQITDVQEDGSRIVDSVRFALCLGDVAEHGYLSECERFNSDVKDPLLNIKTEKCPEGIKLYNIVGNHDLYNSGWQNWADTMYPNTSFYKFETPSFSWYFLDSASGSLGGYQYDAADAAMRADTKKKLVFSHVPVYADDFFYFTMQNTEERNRLISTCAETSTELFVDGHTHNERFSDFGAFYEYNLPGFLEKYGYGILHINEKEGTATMTVKYY